MFESLLDKVLRFLAAALAVAAGLAVLAVLAHAFVAGYHLLLSGKESSTRGLVESLLDGFVLVELLRSFVDYAREHQLHVPLLIETALVFVLREMSSGLYRGHTELGTLLGYALLIPALLVARKMACQQDCQV